MPIFLYQNDEDSASNGGGSIKFLCVDRHVHVEHKSDWYDQTGCEAEAYDAETWKVTGPCDGSCTPHGSLADEAVDLVNRFLSSEGRDLCEWSRTTKRYPDAKAEAKESPYQLRDRW